MGLCYRFEGTSGSSLNYDIEDDDGAKKAGGELAEFIIFSGTVISYIRLFREYLPLAECSCLMTPYCTWATNTRLWKELDEMLALAASDSPIKIVYS